MARDERARLASAAWVRALDLSAGIERDPSRTFGVVIQERAERLAHRPAIESAEGTLSYRALAALANRVSRWAMRRAIGPGEVVALQMPNRADYLGLWLGLTRVGAVVALVGPKLAGDLLVHAVDAARPRHFIVSAETALAAAAVQARFASQPACWVAGPAAPCFDSLADEIASLSPEPLSARECALPTLDRTALLIYTSGTTGLPKAARVSHHRVMQWSHWFAGLMDTGPQDRLYNCLPLHHSVGGVVAMGATLVGGGTVVLRPRFSVSDFWRDLRDERCTVFQYIGELCRYLVNAEPAPVEHSLRLACGNGLRPEVWDAFRTRFRIPRVLEYYAATEGNFSLYNCEEEPGSIGRIPNFLRHRTAVALVRFDVDAGEPLRDAAGFCVRCTDGEVGAALGRVPEGQAQGAGRFEGYLDAEASRRKILRGVFEAGDAWYQTGDLMRRDGRGFFYFVDRIGATFRWKGENVSTSEVAAQLAQCAGVREAVVYGVSVDGMDGRAGMAALVVDDGFDLAAFHADAAARLPEFAMPVFLRVLGSLQVTETHKVKTGGLAAEGFDPDATNDRLFVRDRGKGTYVALDAELRTAILGGHFRL